MDGPGQTTLFSLPLALSALLPLLVGSTCPSSRTQFAWWLAIAVISSLLLLRLDPILDISFYLTQVFLFCSTPWVPTFIFFVPCPVLRLSPHEKTPLTGLSPPASPFPQWALTCQPPSSGGKRGLPKWFSPTFKGTQGVCHFLSDEVCVLPLYQSRSPFHSPSMADRTCSKVWFLSPGSVPAQSAKVLKTLLPPPSPHVLLCVFLFVFMGFFEAI